MPFDALFLTALSEELRPRALGCRVDKVQQPARDAVILALRGPGGGGRLLLTAAPNQPRIHFTDVPQENPAQPPMFCMLLRKHLVGGNSPRSRSREWSGSSTSRSTAPTKWAAPRRST